MASSRSLLKMDTSGNSETPSGGQDVIAGDVEKAMVHDGYEESVSTAHQGASQDMDDLLSDHRKHLKTGSGVLFSKYASIEMSPIRKVLFVFVLVTTQFLTLIAAAQGVPAMVTVQKHFNVPTPLTGELGWSNASFTLGSSAFILIAGKLGDLYGHKIGILGGYAWLTLWSLLTGISYYHKRSAIFFYCCRTLAGIGAGFLAPNATALLGIYFPPGFRKTVIFASMGLLTSLGVVFSLTFASIFAQLATWPWCYYMTTIICFCCLISVYLFVPKDLPDATNVPKWRQFSYFGALFSISGLVLFDVAWTQASAVGWKAPHTYITLIISMVCFAITIIVEYYSKYPLMPIKAMSRDVIATLICIAFGVSSFIVFVNFYWQFYQTVEHKTLLSITAKFSPFAISGIFAACLTTFLLTKKVKTPYMMIISELALLVPPILLATIGYRETYWGNAFVATIISPIGLDIIVPTATLLISNSTSDEYQGTSNAIVVTFVHYAISIGPSFGAVIMSYVQPLSNPPTDHEQLRRIHATGYYATGLAGAGLACALVAAFIDRYFTKKHCQT